MSAPGLDANTAAFLRSLPQGVDLDGDILIVGDGESDHRVRQDGDVLEIEWSLRGVPRETVLVASTAHVLETFLLVTYANAWRDNHGMELLDLWGKKSAPPDGLSLLEEPDGWAVVVVGAPSQVLARRMRRPHAARLARALQFQLDDLITFLQDPTGGSAYSRIPRAGSSGSRT